jgi:uncharacterized protein YkwD
MKRRTIHPDPISRHRVAALARLLATLFAAALPVLILASCSDSGDEPGTQPDTYEYAALEDSILARVNAHRASLSLPALQSNDVIVEQARKHSIYQASVDSTTHDGSAERAAAIGAKITVISIGENVAEVPGWYGTPIPAVGAWLGSPPHRATIEGDFNLTGVGIARSARGAYYVMQIFVKSR